MKYIHTIINNAYTAPYIGFVNKHFDQDEHIFYIIRGWSEDKTPIIDCCNIRVINSYSNILNAFRLIKDLNRSKSIFLHGLFSPFLVILLFFQPWLLKKTSWYIWGGDLHLYSNRNDSFKNRIDNFFRLKTIPKFGKILSPIRGDYELAKQWYNAQGRYECVNYTTPLNTENIDSIITQSNAINLDDTIRIQIGNSAFESNNHFEIIDLLEKFKDKNIKVYAILSYGDSKYASKVIEYGIQKLGNKFEGIIKYMKYEEYVIFLNKMQILVFNHERQQGMGNLYLAMYLKKKIFINNKSTLREYYLENGIVTHNTNDIDLMEYEDFANIDNDELERSRIVLKHLLSNEYIYSLWQKQFIK